MSAQHQPLENSSDNHTSEQELALRFKEQCRNCLYRFGFDDVLVSRVSLKRVGDATHFALPFVASLNTENDREWGFGCLIDQEQGARFIGFRQKPIAFISLLRCLDILSSCAEVREDTLEAVASYVGLSVTADYQNNRIQDQLGNSELRINWNPKEIINIGAGLRAWLDSGQNINLMELLDHLQNNPQAIGSELLHDVATIARRRCIGSHLNLSFRRLYFNLTSLQEDIDSDDLQGAGVHTTASFECDTRDWEASSANSDQLDCADGPKTSASMLIDDLPSNLSQYRMQYEIDRYHKAFEDFYQQIKKGLFGFMHRLEILTQALPEKWEALYEFKLMFGALHDLAMAKTDHHNSEAIFVLRVETLYRLDKQLSALGEDSEIYFMQMGLPKSSKLAWEVQCNSNRFSHYLNSTAYQFMRSMYRMGDYSSILDGDSNSSSSAALMETGAGL